MASCLRLCLDMSMSPEAMETEETAVLGGELNRWGAEKNKTSENNEGTKIVVEN